MRLSTAAIPALVVSCCAFGQTYTIQAFAGGGLPDTAGAPRPERMVKYKHSRAG